MNRQYYIKMLVALHATANKADSDSAEAWTKAEYAVTHARALESMLRDVMTEWHYDSYMNNGEVVEDKNETRYLQIVAQYPELTDKDISDASENAYSYTKDDNSEEWFDAFACSLGSIDEEKSKRLRDTATKYHSDPRDYHEALY